MFNPLVIVQIVCCLLFASFFISCGFAVVAGPPYHGSTVPTYTAFRTMGGYTPYAEVGDSWIYVRLNGGNWQTIFQSPLHYNTHMIEYWWQNGFAAGVYAHDYWGRLGSVQGYDYNAFYVASSAQQGGLDFEPPSLSERDSSNNEAFVNQSYISESPLEYADSIDVAHVVYFDGETGEPYEIDYDFLTRKINEAEVPMLEIVHSNFSYAELQQGGQAIGLSKNEVDQLIDLAEARIAGGNSVNNAKASTQLSTPVIYTLQQNYPNPFNPTTKIGFWLPVDDKVSLAIFDGQGRQIRSFLQEQFQTKGYHEISWDGKNDLGNTVTSGVYFYHFATSKSSATRKMIFLR